MDLNNILHGPPIGDGAGDAVTLETRNLEDKSCRKDLTNIKVRTAPVCSGIGKASIDISSVGPIVAGVRPAVRKFKHEAATKRPPELRLHGVVIGRTGVGDQSGRRIIWIGIGNAL